ncbi:uncharacterized protein LOC116849986 isoform X2 [Odontomachus brunneus]|uniref:uncharacterized protein LOC116849986 isoform X2 n=1 Tax=Odontomachus brunneus TaxID=486640 RepID=UPI0013F17FD3|nr:uncharacterized protein LOC116849986 isoform X2 [Odontomachus brunneus]
MNWRSRLLRRVQKDADDDDGEEDEDGDDRDDERGDDERVLRNTVDFASETWATVSTERYRSGRSRNGNEPPWARETSFRDTSGFSRSETLN